MPSPRRLLAPTFGAIVFDNRNFGASDGEPRQEIDPWQQVQEPRCHHVSPRRCRPPTGH